MITYEQARADHEYLWAISEAYDMTGGYVDSDDLKRLMERPTKRTALECYLKQIAYWFEIGPDEMLPLDDWRNDQIVAEIAERHNCDIPD